MAEASAAPPSGAIDVATFKTELLGEFKNLLGVAVGEALKPIAASIGKLEEEHKTLSGLAGQILKAEDIGKVIDEKIGGAFKARETSADAASKKAEMRKALLEKKNLSGLKPSILAALPDLDDAAALEKAADALIADLNASGVKLPDVGGAAADGGKSVTQQQAAATASRGFLQMPGAAAAAV